MITPVHPSAPRGQRPIWSWGKVSGITVGVIGRLNSEEMTRYRLVYFSSIRFLRSFLRVEAISNHARSSIREDPENFRTLAEGIPIRDRAAGAIIIEQRAALRVLHKNGRRAIDRFRFAAALRVIGIARCIARAAGRDQPAFGVIAIGEGAVEGEIAIAVIGGRSFFPVEFIQVVISH